MRSKVHRFAVRGVTAASAANRIAEIEGVEGIFEHRRAENSKLARLVRVVGHVAAPNPVDELIRLNASQPFADTQVETPELMSFGHEALVYPSRSRGGDAVLKAYFRYASADAEDVAQDVSAARDTQEVVDYYLGDYMLRQALASGGNYLAERLLPAPSYMMYGSQDRAECLTRNTQGITALQEASRIMHDDYERGPDIGMQNIMAYNGRAVLIDVTRLDPSDNFRANDRILTETMRS